jgi:cadmium resistance protein CadD (predicted permease)
MVGGLPADLGLAAVAFMGTNIDNALVAVAMAAAAPPERVRRIALGQALGFVIVVVVAAATALVLFEFSTRLIGLLGLIPLVLGVRGLLLLRRADHRTMLARRAVGSGVIAATMITIASGGDNLSVYIPLFRIGGFAVLGSTALVFVVGEVLLTLFILRARTHPRLRAGMTRVGAVGVPILYCVIGVLVLVQAGTLG